MFYEDYNPGPVEILLFDVVNLVQVGPDYSFHKGGCSK